MSLLNPMCWRKPTPISWAFFAVMPRIWLNFSGSRSKISSVSRPKRSTMRWAVMTPTPLMVPEER